MEFRAKVQKMFRITKNWLNNFKIFTESFAVYGILCIFAAHFTNKTMIYLWKK